MTVAELIEKLSSLSDKTARVVKSPGPWDGLSEPAKFMTAISTRICNSRSKPLSRTQSTSSIFEHGCPKASGK
jgi:hypothetical protein